MALERKPRVIERLCKDCLVQLVFVEPGSRHDLYFCSKCKQIWPWVRNPVMDGSHAQLHKIDQGEYSGLSMLSDPKMKWKPVLTRRPK